MLLLWIAANAVLTALWLRMVWRHFHPREGDDFDWGMTHGNHMVLFGILVTCLWIVLLFPYFQQPP
jgi:hypothetical protein